MERRSFGSGNLVSTPCRSHRKVVSSYLANRLCLDLLVGRQRFQILDNSLVSTDGDLSGPSRMFRVTGPATMHSGGGMQRDTGNTSGSKP